MKTISGSPTYTHLEYIDKRPSIKEFLTQVVDNPEYADILHRKGFNVNMRLYNSNPEYRAMIRKIIDFMTSLFKKSFKDFWLGGISGANFGMPLNIIAYKTYSIPKTEIMINPRIKRKSKETRSRISKCGSINDGYHSVERPVWIDVEWYDIDGVKHTRRIISYVGVICHETDHNLGILITDKEVR